MKESIELNNENALSALELAMKLLEKRGEWLRTPHGNLVLNIGDSGSYISYNEDTSNSGGNLFLGHLEDMMNRNYGTESGEETALYLKDNDEFLILEGDFRAEYEAVADKGVDACLQVYDKYSFRYKKFKDNNE